jgi:lactate dehydrogenase-like 2-hydroxyacid dehydrogenase
MSARVLACSGVTRKIRVLLVLSRPGGLIDYDAARRGLESGHIGGLGLDVQWQEPWDADDFIGAAHPKVRAGSADQQDKHSPTWKTTHLAAS